MKRYIITAVLLVVFSTLTVAQELFIQPFYWVAGGIEDIRVEGETVSANGRQVYLYKSLEEFKAGNFISAEVLDNTLIINGFDLGLEVFRVGETYNVATEMIRVAGAYYGAGGTIKISGDGWDEVSDLKLAGGYLAPGVVVEEPPEMKIWFGYRLYQKKLVERGDVFVVSSQPSIKLDLSIKDPYTLARDVTDYSIVVDAGTVNAETLELKTHHMTQKTYASGTSAEEQKIKSMTLQYELAEALVDGKHTFDFTAASSGDRGLASQATESASVEVIGGPVRIIGIPITFPSPFSITKQGTVTIQYQLSMDTDIRIILVDISGRRVRNFIFTAGAEGGNAGINKVTWNGRTDRGTLAGNGIYLGTILSRQEGRKLGSVKLTIVD